eukprot:Phypoly_transcript_06181.p1 GENE.Phypoly_transcript_06181~~Phypoly_transcript_06181.p1  ORF type:complete len:593 (+),score=128.36 Phypoly_transcript_06181:1-1779(+)
MASVSFDPVYEFEAPKFVDFTTLDESDASLDKWFDIGNENVHKGLYSPPNSETNKQRRSHRSSQYKAVSRNSTLKYKPINITHTVARKSSTKKHTKRDTISTTQPTNGVDAMILAEPAAIPGVAEVSEVIALAIEPTDATPLEPEPMSIAEIPNSVHNPTKVTTSAPPKKLLTKPITPNVLKRSNLKARVTVPISPLVLKRSRAKKEVVATKRRKLAEVKPGSVLRPSTSVGAGESAANGGKEDETFNRIAKAIEHVNAATAPQTRARAKIATNLASNTSRITRKALGTNTTTRQNVTKAKTRKQESNTTDAEKHIESSSIAPSLPIPLATTLPTTTTITTEPLTQTAHSFSIPPPTSTSLHTLPSSTTGSLSHPTPSTIPPSHSTTHHKLSTEPPTHPALHENHKKEETLSLFPCAGEENPNEITMDAINMKFLEISNELARDSDIRNSSITNTANAISTTNAKHETHTTNTTRTTTAIHKTKLTRDTKNTKNTNNTKDKDTVPATHEARPTVTSKTTQKGKSATNNKTTNSKTTSNKTTNNKKSTKAPKTNNVSTKIPTTNTNHKSTKNINVLSDDKENAHHNVRPPWRI